MKELHLYSPEERKPFFESAAYDTQISFEIIEKDYWVVWTLDRLFSLPDLKSHLTFKGGTSLSKIYGIIERFSEDIDVSIEREFLGFGDTKDPEKLPSRKKQRALLDDLSLACSKYIQGKLISDLTASITDQLGKQTGWRVLNDPDDVSGQTLLFEYPSLCSQGEYIRPFVKIEMGARSEHSPVSQHKIRSYGQRSSEGKNPRPEITVRVLNSERTFWEKATILHQYAHWPEDKPLPARLSRHLYDFFCLLKSATKDTALQKIELLERVAKHKSIYFASGWANYDTARKGTLRLSLPERLHEELKKTTVK